uniref:NOT2_3_5 domain-containing protein n=1 Tax=Syphacia muris TaxID=451379 RepID=A0A0N5AGC6_9BILA
MDYRSFQELEKDQGRICNGSTKLLSDQFGMSALACVLHHIYGSEEDDAVRLLMLGLSCAKLGMERNNLVDWYPTFGGPWAAAPCKARDLDVKVPSEYLTNVMIRGKLPNIRLNNLSEDTLFFLFYNFPGEVYQRAAACELFNRNWRYHKIKRVWLTRTKPGEVRVQTSTYEVGTYSVFDHVQWRKMQTQMRVDYQDLEERPQLPETMQAYCSQVASHNVYQNPG